MSNYQVRIRKVPEGAPSPDDFSLVATEVPTPRKGEMLCRTRWLSLDPFSHHTGASEGWLAPGAVMPARAICEVVDSRNEVFNVGELVVMDAGLQNYCVSSGMHVQRIRTGGAPLTTALGVMGVPGLTAYCGLLDLASVKQGEIVLVSAAAGATGSMVGQIARIKGCKVIGIAGTREKCEWCVKQAHFAACINYRTEQLSQRLSQLAPHGVDVYFDNSGGDILDAVVSGNHVREGGRIVLCGLTRTSDLVEGESTGPRPRLLPLVPHHLEHRRDAFLKDAIAWFAEGHLRYKEDIVEGLHNAAEHFCRLMRGENFGKALVKT
jgi:NADPH-dependent curcumin reductase